MWLQVHLAQENSARELQSELGVGFVGVEVVAPLRGAGAAVGGRRSLDEDFSRLRRPRRATKIKKASSSRCS